MATLGKEKEDAFLSVKNRMRVEEITPHVEALSALFDDDDDDDDDDEHRVETTKRRRRDETRVHGRRRASEKVRENADAKKRFDRQEDAMGTIFGRLEGTETVKKEERNEETSWDLDRTDAIPLSGKYDGVYGVLGAVEALGALKRAKFQLRGAISRRLCLTAKNRVGSGWRVQGREQWVEC